jgi:hypothetical protein
MIVNGSYGADSRGTITENGFLSEEERSNDRKASTNCPFSTKSASVKYPLPCESKYPKHDETRWE